MAARKRAPGGGRKRTIASKSERLHIGKLCEKKQSKKMWERVHKRLEETPQGRKARARLETLFDKRNSKRSYVNGIPDWERPSVNDQWNDLSAERERHFERYFNKHMSRKGYRSATIDDVAKKTGYPKRVGQSCWVEYRADRAARVRALVEGMNWVALSVIGKK